MDIIQGFIQPPKQQTADDTIPTLCDAVENSTLISDRRSAVLGLKSFSRQYRETVIASGLKPLINTLKKDYEDLDTSRAILETLLILFIRGEGNQDLTRDWVSTQSRLQNGKYPSPLVMKQEIQTVDQFSLWIADALLQSPEVVKIIFYLMDSSNFHVKLYTIQILEALVATRPLRTRETIIAVPTAISQLVFLLNDPMDAVRDEAILLLMSVVNDNTHIQSLVAFENIFERLFTIISDEGGLRGSIVVNDSLALISNILKYNNSNQTLFFESGNVPQLAQLLSEPLEQGEKFYWNDQRISNVNTTLDIVRTLVVPGNSSTPSHQKQLFDFNILMIISSLAFYLKTPKEVRPNALITASDIIRDNESLQYEFSKIDVPYIDPSMPISAKNLKDGIEIYPSTKVLLSWALNINSVHFFEIRVSSLDFLKAYLGGSLEIQKSFVQSQIQEYQEGIAESDKSFNMFQTLLEYNPDLNLNPYKLFFSVELLIYLFHDDETGELKRISRSINSGSSEDSENMTSIQSLCELFLTYLSLRDIRISLSYLSLLAYWIFADFQADNDFLFSKANVNQFISLSTQSDDGNILIKCMIIMLLGISYEFCTKDSFIPRAEYHDTLLKMIGLDNYRFRVKQFVDNTLFVEAAEINFYSPGYDETGLPKIFFSPLFVDLIKKNFYQIQTALNRDPTVEPKEKLSFKVFEQTQSECAKLEKELNDSNTKNGREIDDLKNSLTILTKDYDELSENFNSLTTERKNLDNEMLRVKTELDKTLINLREITSEKNALMNNKLKNEKQKENLDKLLISKGQELEKMQKELTTVKSEKSKADDGINKMNRELMKLTKSSQALKDEIEELKATNEKLKKNYQKEIESLNKKITKKESDFDLEKRKVAELQNKLSRAEMEKNTLQRELDDLRPRFKSNDELVSKLTEKLKSLALNTKTISAEKESLLQQLKSFENTKNEKLVELQTKYDNLELEKNDLENERNDLLSSIDSFEEEIKVKTNQLKDKDTELNTSRLNNEMEISKLKEGLATESNKIEKNKSLYENSIKELEEKLASKEQEMENSLSQLKDTKCECDNLTIELKKISSEQKRVAGELEEKRAELDDLTTNLESKEENLKESTKKYQELQTTLDLQNKDYELKLSGATQKLTEKSDELNVIIQNKVTLEKILDETKAKFVESDKGNKSEITKLKEIINVLQAKNETISKEKTDVESKLQESKKSVSDQLPILKQLEEENFELKRNLESMKNENIAHEKSNKGNEKLLSDLRATLDSLKEEKSQVEGKLNQVQTDLEKNKQEMQLLEKKSVKLEEDLAGLNEENNTIKKEAEKRKEEMKEHISKLAVLKDENSKHQQLLKDHESNMEKFKEENTNLVTEKESLAKKMSEEVMNLEEKVKKLQQDLKAKSQSFEKERKLLNEGSNSITQEYSEKITKLEEQIAKMEFEQADKNGKVEQDKVNLEECIKEKEKELEEFKSKLSQMTTNADNLEKELTAAKVENSSINLKNQEKWEELTKKFLMKKDDLEKKIIETKELETQLKSSQNLHLKMEDELKLLKEEKLVLDANLKRLEEDNKEKILNFETKFEQCEKNLDSTTKKIQSTEKELEELREKFNTKSEESANLQTELESTKKELERMKMLSSELECFKTKVSKKEAEIKEISLDRERYKASELTLEDQNGKLKQQLEELKTELTKQKELTKSIKEENAKKEAEFQGEINKINVELQSWKEKKVTDRTELDELMLLVDDLDETNKIYKEKLKALGQEFSSDEEVDDEDYSNDEETK
ncbi:related to Intracellular protein transport protein USO1 [Saccharomycodes ludwigii]|uniref:Related to Intracellular protein transport protein USO1 n=1 Tax=Saccharomycodes ludwigii TaxID=36035 RepID=A0A376B126_9ASCO|nr:related to Intracellular protein transport protein USO1 [Saccharomycodes ludwigii]